MRGPIKRGVTAAVALLAAVALSGCGRQSEADRLNRIAHERPASKAYTDFQTLDGDQRAYVMDVMTPAELDAQRCENQKDFARSEDNPARGMCQS